MWHATLPTAVRIDSSCLYPAMVIIVRAPGNEALGKPTEEIHDLHDRLNLIKAGSN
jgi:hypothetical protein